MISRILKRIGKHIKKRNMLYNKAVLPALALEFYSRLSGDREAIKYAMKFYEISRDVRALETFLYEYNKHGDIKKAIDRALFQLKKHYK